MEEISFEGQVAVVTGAGRGLGRQYALDLARRGAAVVVNDLGGSTRGEGADVGVADEVVAEIRAAGGTAVASHDSVATPEGGAAIVQAAVDAFGRLDAVVSNAGTLDTAPFEDLTLDSWRRLLGVHLDGAFHVGQPAYRAMKDQGYGRFVFIASSAGAFGQHHSAHYAAAKMGIVGLSNVVALEGEPHGITSNTVLPFGASRMAFATAGDAKDIPEVAAYLDAIRPELVVPVVTYLASRACPVTHHNISAGGGRYTRVFVGLGPGWMAGAGHEPSAEDVAAHWDEIASVEPFTVPGAIYDEVAALTDLLGITGIGPDSA